MHLRSFWIGLLALMFLPTAVVGAERKSEVSLTLYTGGYFPDGDRHLDDSLVYGARLGYAFVGSGLAEALTLEGDFGLIDSSSGQGRGYSARLDAVYPLRKKGTLLPYLSLGGGFVDPPGSAEDLFSVAYGGGLFYGLAPAIALRVDLRHLLPMSTDHFNDFTATAGITYFFGRKADDLAKKPKDADRDGVADSRDRCPDTPKGLKVDRFGCPENPPDGDGDGIADYQDQCLDTKPGVDVDSNGCPRDSDGDGVPDSVDECPGNPPGLPVDARGCVQIN